MKQILLKSMALASLFFSGIVSAEVSEADLPIGVKYYDKEAKSKADDPNAEDSLANRGIGSGFYYLFLGASGAAVTNSNPTYAYSGGGCMQRNSGGVIDGDFDLDIQVPDGHEIQGIRYYFYDNSAGSSALASFKFDGEGGLTLLDSILSTGDTGYGNIYQAFTTPHVVDNITGHLVLRFNSNEDGNDQRLCGARIFIEKP